MGTIEIKDGCSVCTDTDDGAEDRYGDTCALYSLTPGYCGGDDDEDFVSNDM